MRLLCSHPAGACYTVKQAGISVEGQRKKGALKKGSQGRHVCCRQSNLLPKHMGFRTSGQLLRCTTWQARAHSKIIHTSQKRLLSLGCSLFAHTQGSCFDRNHLTFWKYHAGLYMALNDAEAADRTMQAAIEAKRLALGPGHPAVTESVLGLAAIKRAAGHGQAAIDVLQRELNFLNQNGPAASPGEHLESGYQSRSLHQEACAEQTMHLIT